VVVRVAVRGPVIDVAADAKTEFGILVQDLARVGAWRALLELVGNEVRFQQRPCHEAGDLCPALRASIGLQRLTDIGGELVKSVGHGGDPSSKANRA
jgi:hypothetical protein